MVKRGGAGVFSPDNRNNQRQRMDVDMTEEKLPEDAILDLTDTDFEFDIEILKLAFKDIPEWTTDFAKYLAKVISHSIKQDVNGILESSYKGMKAKITQLEVENVSLKQKLSEQEAYSRRSNLIINGIPEHSTQNLFNVFDALAKHELGIEKDLKIERIHRMGPPPRSEQQGPRPIIVRFAFYQDRQLVWLNRKRRDPRNFEPIYLNRAPRFSITEDFPQHIAEARKRLSPIAYEARTHHGMEATVKLDKLIIDGKTYDVNSIDKLPQSLKPISMSYRETNEQISFFRKHCPLSNHSPAPFTINGHTYNCTEQMFLSEKCFAYGHPNEGNNILRMDDPGKMVQEAKVCGKGFNPRWHENMIDTMVTANLGKFTQNEMHRDFLMSTGNKVLVEGSPYDTTWGVGILFNDPLIDDDRNWLGDNLLGEALMTVRRLIRPGQPKQAPKMDQASHPDEVTIQASQGFPVTSAVPSTSHAAAAINHTQGFDPHYDPQNENLRPHSPSMERR